MRSRFGATVTPRESGHLITLTQAATTWSIDLTDSGRNASYRVRLQRR